MKVKFKKFSFRARIPTKVTPGSACYDIYSARDAQLVLGITKTVDHDLGFQFLKKFSCRIYHRSGLSLKPLLLGGGVLDSDYQGNISVIPTNSDLSNVEIQKGAKIAQIMFFEKRRCNF